MLRNDYLCKYDFQQFSTITATTKTLRSMVFTSIKKTEEIPKGKPHFKYIIQIFGVLEGNYLINKEKPGKKMRTHFNILLFF
jgi:hypothetical protein